MRNKYKIKISSKAISDYQNILENTYAISINYYKRFNERLTSKLQNLFEFPYIYQRLSDRNNLRKIVIENYILIYEVQNNIISIYRIHPYRVNYLRYI